MNKTERQNIGIYKYLQAGAIGCLLYTMRFGKTLIALKIIERLLKKFPASTVFVIVPNVTIKQTWLNEIDTLDKFEYSNLHNYSKNKTMIMTANEILNYSDMVVDLLVIDELHKFISEERTNLINNTKVKYKWNLGLTGTYPYNNKVVEKHFPIVDIIEEEEAIREGWISKYREYNIKLELDTDDKEKYYKYSKIMNEIGDIFHGLYTIFDYKSTEHFFNSDLDLILSCYKGKSTKTVYVKGVHIRQLLSEKMGWSDELDLDTKRGSRIETYWNPDNIKKNAIKYYNAMQARNDILKFNKTKLEATMDIYHKYRDYNIICFNESINFATIIVDTINNLYKEDKAIAYHSKIKGQKLVDFITGEYFKTKDGRDKEFGKTRVLKYIIEMFKIEKYKFIGTVNSMDEGLNIPQLNMVISTAGTINPMQYSQRTARAKTVNIGKADEVVIIVNLFFDDFKYKVDREFVYVKSRDKTKLHKRQDYKNIPIYTLEDFLNNVKISS